MHVYTKKYQRYLILFWQFLSTSVISAVTASSPVFAFRLCVAFPTSHMFLVNASVNFFLPPSSYGFHVAAHRPCSVLFYLLVATTSSLTYFHSPPTPLPAVPKSVFCSFFPCRPHSPSVFVVQDIVYNRSTNYGWPNIIHCMWNFCRKDR